MARGIGTGRGLFSPAVLAVVAVTLPVGAGEVRAAGREAEVPQRAEALARVVSEAARRLCDAPAAVVWERDRGAVAGVEGVDRPVVVEGDRPRVAGWYVAHLIDLPPPVV